MKALSRRQFALFRVLLGLYLAVHFAALIPWANELWSSAGVLANPALNRLHGLFPNPLAWWSPPPVPALAVGALAVLSLLFAAGVARRTMAVLLWFGLTCLFNRNNLIANPSLPYVGLLLLATTLVPLGEGWTPRQRDAAGWFFPRSVFTVVWVLMAVGYSFSGWVKLGSPSWVDGTALLHVAENPLARPWFVRDLVAGLPPILLQLLTWGALALEVGFAPLALWRKARPWVWLGAVGLHLGILSVVDFADLTTGMLLLHLFTFDPEWLAPRPARQGRHLLLYDGVCGLCDRTVQFLLEEDRGGVLFFAPLQGETAKQAAERLGFPLDLQTVVLVTEAGSPGERVLTRSSAVLGALDAIGGFWRPLSWARVLPRPLRDRLYDFVAARRYSWFGRFETCKLPSPETRARFLP